MGVLLRCCSRDAIPGDDTLGMYFPAHQFIGFCSANDTWGKSLAKHGRAHFVRPAHGAAWRLPSFGGVNDSIDQWP